MLASCLVVLGTACGNGNLRSKNTTPAAAVAVSVTPASSTLVETKTVNLTASVANTSNTAVTWSVQEAGGGSITAAGVYTAPAAAGTYHVIATSQADTSKTAAATVTVTPGPAPSFSSTAPTSASEGVSYSYPLAASDPAGGAVHFALTSGPSGATLSGTTLTWTPASAQSRTANDFTVTATSTEGGSATQSFTLTPLGTVRITAVDPYVAQIGTSTVPEDLSAATYRILAPDGQGGYTTLTGAGTASGTFAIPNVPPGAYYLQFSATGHTYLWTSASNIDAGSAFLGRAKATTANTGSLLNFNLTNMSAFQNNDDIEVYSPNAGGCENFEIVSCNLTLPANSSTTYSGSADWSGNSLIDSNQGDTLYVLKLSTTVQNGISFVALTDLYTNSSFVQNNGTATAVSGAFTSLSPTSTLRAAANGPTFVQAITAPSVVQGQAEFGVFAQPAGPFTSELGVNPALVGLKARTGQNITANMDAGDIAYADPFPASWLRYFQYTQSAQQSYLAPGASNPTLLGLSSNLLTTAMPSAAAPAAALLGPVTGLTLNGVSLDQPQTAVGTTPTIAWQAPQGATDFRVFVRSLTASGANSVQTLVFLGQTTGTSLQIPPGVLTAGTTYMVKIEAISQAVDWSTTPNRFALPFGLSSAAGSTFVP